MAGQEGTANLRSSESNHRLPTVSASQALETLKSQRPQAISTGLPQLDRLLYGSHGESNHSEPQIGGIARGKVTEIYGPPGVGKTTFAMQACAAALRTGEHVAWVDASYDLVKTRLCAIMHHASLSSQPNSVSENTFFGMSNDAVLSRLHHFNTHSLAHLLALIIHTPPSFPPPSTSLLIVDSLSTLFDTAYAGHQSKSNFGNADQRTKDARRWAANRRFAILGSLISALNKLAAVQNIAILVTSQMMTRVSPGGAGTRAILVPALSGKEWEMGVASRVVLFRDWAPEELRRSSQGKDAEKIGAKLGHVRFAGVVKTNGLLEGELSSQGNTLRSVVPFTIDEIGIVPYTNADTTLRTLSSPIKLSSSTSRKRNFREIADSDAETDEEYGWAEEDEIVAEGLVDEISLAAASIRPTKEGSSEDKGSEDDAR